MRIEKEIKEQISIASFSLCLQSPPFFQWQMEEPGHGWPSFFVHSFAHLFLIFQSPSHLGPHCPHCPHYPQQVHAILAMVLPPGRRHICWTSSVGSIFSANWMHRRVSILCPRHFYPVVRSKMLTRPKKRYLSSVQI